MKRAVEERKQPEHAAEFYERVNAEDFAQRRDCNSEAEKYQREYPCCFGDEIERIRTDTFMVKIPQQQHERDKRVYKDDEFREANISHDQKYFTKSIP